LHCPATSARRSREIQVVPRSIPPAKKNGATTSNAGPREGTLSASHHSRHPARTSFCVMFGGRCHCSVHAIVLGQLMRGRFPSEYGAATRQLSDNTSAHVHRKHSTTPHTPIIESAPRRQLRKPTPARTAAASRLSPPPIRRVPGQIIAAARPFRCGKSIARMLTGLSPASGGAVFTGTATRVRDESPNVSASFKVFAPISWTHRSRKMSKILSQPAALRPSKRASAPCAY